MCCCAGTLFTIPDLPPADHRADAILQLFSTVTVGYTEFVMEFSWGHKATPDSWLLGEPKVF